MGGVNPLVVQGVVTSVGVLGRSRVPFEYSSSPMLQPHAHAGQPETPTSASITNEDLLKAINGNAASLMQENRTLRSENARLLALVEGLTNSVVYTAVKRRDNLVKVGYTQDWERRRKEHERNGWEIVAFQADTQKTEQRFKAVLHSQGIDPVGGKGFKEVYRLSDPFLSCARNFQWPLGAFTKPLPYRKSTPYSISGSGPVRVGSEVQGKLWGGVA